eukprot:TRINITY_DN13813_c0_g1_i1.p1 TRINITY_DN13813_c0_g1~~TRINITY_DN13813_c0_g1_i1.p1  ORF type:complete len:988 (+),score=187.43 TRINITY_DN13813_c0_g1_i1:65-3028(+)
MKYILLAILAMVFGTSVAVEVKLLVVEYQPLQPYGKWESPCSNVFKDGCKAGFAAQAAIIRHNSGNNSIKIGSFLAASGLIESHPRWIQLNYDLYSSAGFDAIFLRDPDQFSNQKRIEEAIKLLYTTRIPVIASNVAEDNMPYRGYVDHYLIKSPVEGITIGVLNAWPQSHWYPTLSDDYVIESARILRAASGVTHVVLYAPTFLLPNSVDKFANSGEFDVICYTVQPSSSNPPPSEIRTVRADGTVAVVFVVRMESLYHRVDEIAISFNDNGVIRKVSTKAHSTASLHEDYKDEQYNKDMMKLQQLVTEATATDEVIGISTQAMPAGSYKLNGVKYSPCWVAECELGTLLTQAMRVPRQVDIAFANGGAIELGWEAGDVKASMFPLAFPYKNTFCYFEATASELYRILEESVRYVATDGSYNRTAAVPGRFLQISGLRYSFNPSLNPGQRITAIDQQDSVTGIWSSIDMFKTYSVVTNNFLCAGGDDYDFQPVNGTLEFSQTDSLGHVMSHFREQSPYTPHLPGNIVVDMEGSHVKFAKDSTDCNTTERFDSQWDVCIPCLPGYYHPLPGDDPCIVEPKPPGEETGPLIYVVSSIILFLVCVAIASLYVIQRQKAQIRSLTKYAPTGGKIAIVFTDIQSSSKLWGDQPHDMSIALDIHHSICRSLISKHRGYEVKTIGDAFMIVFACPVDAANFNCELQIRLYEAEWPKGLTKHSACKFDSGKFNGLRVRSGMHYGSCVVKTTPTGGYDYEGNVVNTTARVSDSGEGGQVVITEAAYDAIEEHLADIDFNIDVKYLGEYCFSGISEPVACIQALPDVFSSRQFPGGLRNAKPVDSVPEVKTRRESITDRHSAGTSIFGEKGELLDSMQSLRRYIGHDGISVVSACELLMVPMQEGSVTDFKVLSTMMRVLLSSADHPTTTARERREALLTVDKPQELSMVKWGIFSRIIAKLPTAAVVSMSQHIALSLSPRNREPSGTASISLDVQ